MSNEFIDKAVNEIWNQKNDGPATLNMAMAAAWIVGNFKGLNLKILDVRKNSSLADYFVLGSATNLTQSQSMAEEIVRQFKRHGHQIVSREGYNTDWILIDTGDILVHIFQDSTRSAYDLDGLWGNSPQVEIPQTYYYSSDQREGVPAPGKDSDTGRDFF